MYIRRKVFSVAVDENGEERYFSTNEIINEEDYLEEVTYSDLEEREFASKDKIAKKILNYRGVAKQAQRISGHPYNLESRIRGEFAEAANSTARGNRNNLIQSQSVKNKQAEFQGLLRNRRQFLAESGNAPLTRLQNYKIEKGIG